MKYYYDIFFYLADEEKRIEIDLQNWENTFLMAEDHYNLGGKNARNIKQIVDTEVKEKEVRLRLVSDSQLEKPTLALRSYSQFLVQTEFGEVAANNNALFRGSYKIVEKENGNVTGPEMLKILAELLMANRKSDGRLIETIKEQLVEWRDNQ